MALIDTGEDVWLTEFESCDRLYNDILQKLNSRNLEIRGSDKFNATSASVRIQLSQFNIELSQLDDRLKTGSSTVTRDEFERRQRLVEDLLSKFVRLTRMYKTSTETNERGRLFGNWADDEQSDDVPLLHPAEDFEESVEQLRNSQRQILAQQDRGLDNLATIIGRQKSIAATISQEVDSQNDLIDDIGDRMDAATSGIRGASSTVTSIGRSDSTFIYWLIILLLLIAIAFVAY